MNISGEQTEIKYCYSAFKVEILKMRDLILYEAGIYKWARCRF